ncbi:MAG: hypothetical protein VX778_00930, partial [Candidatus Thermoplasmatota archaeon]|nr:hypothetical protein [Candidatus Thermoplasmatota archaeon]
MARSSELPVSVPKPMRRVCAIQAAALVLSGHPLQGAFFFRSYRLQHFDFTFTFATTSTISTVCF